LSAAKEEAVMQQWYQCTRCGSQIAYGTGFCSNCGNQLYWSNQQQPQYSPLYQQAQQPRNYQQQALQGKWGITQEQNTSGQGGQAIFPDEIRHWNWGAFIWVWIWGIGNNTWIALIGLIPYVNFVMAFILGAKGNEWAWRNKKWDNIDHFQRTQKAWAYWGLGICIIPLLIGLIGFIYWAYSMGYLK